MRPSNPTIWSTDAMIKFTEAKSAAPKGGAHKSDDPAQKAAEPTRAKGIPSEEGVKTPTKKGKKGRGS
jgi:hypothetical protein